MSAPTLSEALSLYGQDAYLLTVGKTGPHTGQVSVHLDGNVITCMVGASAAKNISSEPNVSLFWPPKEHGGYAMIVNGTATGTLGLAGVTRAEIVLTKSVFHRAGPKPLNSDGPCASDCRQLARTA